MLMLRWKMILGLVLVVSVIAVAAALGNFRARADEKSAKEAPPKGAEAQNGEKLKALLLERRAFAKQQFDSSRRHAIERLKEYVSLSKAVGRSIHMSQEITSHFHRARIRVVDAQKLFGWAERLLTAELELSDKKADRVAAYEAHLQRIKELEEEFHKEAEGVEGGEGIADVAEGKFHRLEAEIMLERAKAN
jgi:hypothetical protein